MFYILYANIEHTMQVYFQYWLKTLKILEDI